MEMLVQRKQLNKNTCVPALSLHQRAMMIARTANELYAPFLNSVVGATNSTIEHLKYAYIRINGRKILSCYGRQKWFIKRS